MATENPTDNIFSGLKVVDLASFIAGPSAAVILSDFGADVIKVEPPSGELWRRANQIPPQPQAKDAYQWHLNNRNKRGLTLDLKSPGAQPILEKLVKWADVLVVNTPHPARKRLKLEYEDVVQWNPRLIYADVTGFGDKGPDAELPGFDITAYWARSGLLSMTRDAGVPPTWPVAGSGDNATAVGLYSAIVTGLYRRERTGKGSHVTTSLLAEGIWSASVSIQGALSGAKFYGQHDRKNPANAAMNVYQAADGTLVRGLQWGPRHVRRRARAGRGDRRSAAATEWHRRSSRRRWRQSDLDDQQSDSGARRREGICKTSSGARRTQRRDSPATRVRRERDRRFPRERDDSATSAFSSGRGCAMSDIDTERSGSILRIQLNRPAKKNAMTSSMYISLADLLNGAAADDQIRVVLWHGAGDSFCAGNDIEDFLKNPVGPGESPQSRLMKAFINFDKPLVAAVHGAAIGGGTTMLTHCDFVYAGESAKFQMPFINLALVPEFGTSYSIPARVGHLRAADLILLGAPFDARRAADLGLVTAVVPDRDLMATATETARKLAAKPAGALQVSKRLMKRPFREQLRAAVKVENEEFVTRLRSADAKEAFTAFIEKRRPDFTRTKNSATAA